MTRTFKQWEWLITESKAGNLVASLMYRLIQNSKNRSANSHELCEESSTVIQYVKVHWGEAIALCVLPKEPKGQREKIDCLAVSVFQWKVITFPKNMLESPTSNRKMCLTGEGCGTGRKCFPMESQKHCTAGPTCVTKYHLHWFRYIISATCTVQYNRNWRALKTQLNFQRP